MRSSISANIANSVACAIIGARLDYCNSILYNISDNNISKLSVFRTLWLKSSQTPKKEHIMPVLEKIHWLPVLARIIHKIAMVTSKIRQMGIPEYISLSIQSGTYSWKLCSIGTDLLMFLIPNLHLPTLPAELTVTPHP